MPERRRSRGRGSVRSEEVQARTPIRKAMARIEAARLVHTTPGRSTVVSTIEDKAVLEAQAVAATMHALAVRIAVPLMDKGQIASELTGRRGFRTTASALRTRLSVTSCQNTPAAEHVNLHFCCHITGSISRSCTSRKLTSFGMGFVVRGSVSYAACFS